ncbi:hypothetical protein KRR39_07360 [Nocardioides panacis]|uniref:Ig-like domain-containing protein n=1 Tax=Nocardioides panacis TaxID=2849501 RepID=A0A975Y1J0_9ACTN|nr:hypothetical protein [Nocardioides panacis]QWZ09562.1 hypothetical protein KRR39_07360 [Nocardioides panacis]
MHRTHVLRRGIAALTTLLLAASGISLVATKASAAVDVGYVGPSYAGTTQQPNAPTAEKPQSKLWYAQDKWWGAMWDTASNDYVVWGYDWTKHEWAKTPTVLETRTRVDMDVLWDGTHLYVVSTPKTSGPNPPADTTTLLRRFSFDAVKGSWISDGTPVQLASGLSYSPVIDKDSTGTLWVTYTTGVPGVDPVHDPTADTTRAARVMITHSQPTDDRAWVAPYQLPTPDDSSTVTFDPAKDPGGQPSSDIAAVVSFDGNKVGVLWSNQRTQKVHWATHVDGDPDQTWATSVAYDNPQGSDDHLNIKSVAGGNAGRVFAVAKTSHTGATDPLINLLYLDLQGNWSARPFATVADNVTRASVVIDSDHHDLYVFAAGPCCAGGTIYYKKTPLANPTFGSGPGTPFIFSNANPEANNVTTTKQTVTSASGLLALAGDDQTRTYLYNQLELGTGTTISTKPAASVATGDATFEFTATEPGATFLCSLDGAVPAACTSPQSYTGLTNGNHTFSVRGVGAAGAQDGTPVTYTWNVAVPAGDTVAPSTGISLRPKAVSTAREAAFTLVSDEAGSTFRCSLDGKPAVVCTSPVVYRGLADGDHTFAAAAVDAAGNADATPDVYSWKITPWFFDGFSSKNFTHGGWLARHSRTGSTAVVKNAVYPGDTGARIRSVARRGSTASITKRLPAASSTLGFSWVGRVGRPGLRGQTVDVASLRNAAGKVVLSVERVSSNGKLRVRLPGGVTPAVKGPAVAQRARFMLDVTVNPRGKDAWALSVDGRTVLKRSASNLGSSGLRSLRFGSVAGGRSLDYRVDSVKVWQ